MTFRKLLVPLCGREADDGPLAAAFTLARQFQAHVEGFLVRPDPRESLPYLGEGVSGAVLQDVINAAQEAGQRQAEAAARRFEKAAGIAHVPEVEASHGPGHASARFVSVEGSVAGEVARRARLADLVIFDRSCEGDPEFPAARSECLMETGRAVLLVPPSSPSAIGTRVTIGWDASAEAAGAVRQARPFLLEAERVEILCLGGESLGEDAGKDLRDYLVLHGVDAAIRRVDPGVRSIGEALLEETERLGNNLLVMGAYGHSRVRELLLGGATRHILTSAALPVFMAH